MGFLPFNIQGTWCSEILISLTKLVSRRERIWIWIISLQSSHLFHYDHTSNPPPPTHTHTTRMGLHLLPSKCPMLPKDIELWSLRTFKNLIHTWDGNSGKVIPKTALSEKILSDRAQWLPKWEALQGVPCSFGCVSSMVLFKATVRLLNIHTTWLPWSSNKLSQNQLFTLNDFTKLALVPQLDDFKCKLLA